MKNSNKVKAAIVTTTGAIIATAAGLFTNHKLQSGKQDKGFIQNIFREVSHYIVAVAVAWVAGIISIVGAYKILDSTFPDEEYTKTDYKPMLTDSETKHLKANVSEISWQHQVKKESSAKTMAENLNR